VTKIDISNEHWWYYVGGQHYIFCRPTSKYSPNTSYKTCSELHTFRYVEGRPISHLVDVGSGTGKLSLTAITFVRIMTANLRTFGRIICRTFAAVRPYNASRLKSEIHKIQSLARNPLPNQRNPLPKKRNPRNPPPTMKSTFVQPETKKRNPRNPVTGSGFCWLGSGFRASDWILWISWISLFRQTRVF